MKIKFKMGILLLQIGGLIACTLTGPDSTKKHLPTGRFSTHSIVRDAIVHPDGHMDWWYDTATLVLEITPDFKWIYSETLNDTCMYLKTVSGFQFDGDAASILHTHGTRFKSQSPKCDELWYEFDIDSTWKIPVKSFSNDEIQLIGKELSVERVFSYRRISEN